MKKQLIIKQYIFKSNIIMIYMLGVEFKFLPNTLINIKNNFLKNEKIISKIKTVRYQIMHRLSF